MERNNFLSEEEEGAKNEMMESQYDDFLLEGGKFSFRVLYQKKKVHTKRLQNLLTRKNKALAR